MKKEALVFIKHILESIEDIENYSKSVSKNQFFKDKKLQDAIVKRIEIIGEAVKNLPRGFTNKYPFVPWSEIARTRDKMVHHYFGVDLDIVWDIVKKDLPGLKKDIKEILDKEK